MLEAVVYNSMQVCSWKYECSTVNHVEEKIAVSSFEQVEVVLNNSLENELYFLTNIIIVKYNSLMLNILL